MMSDAIDRIGESWPIKALKSGQPVAWGSIRSMLERYITLPEESDRRQISYNIVPRAVEKYLGGKQGEKWDAERRPSKTNPSVHTTYVVPTGLNRSAIG
jgi:hypothetical protein